MMKIAKGDGGFALLLNERVGSASGKRAGSMNN